MLREFFYFCTGTGNKTGGAGPPVRRLAMGTREKLEREKVRQELAAYLRKLAKWKNNDVVKLAFLDAEDVDRVDKLDLTGVVELKRNANGTFEARFVDKVRVLGMLRELMDEKRDGELGDFLDGLYQAEDGDEV